MKTFSPILTVRISKDMRQALINKAAADKKDQSKVVKDLIRGLMNEMQSADKASTQKRKLVD